MIAENDRSRVGCFWRLIEIFAVSCFLLTLLVMFIQVASRYALGVPVPWTDETSRFFFIAAVFSGAVICQRHGLQIRITVVLDLLPTLLRRWFEIASDLFTAVVAMAVLVGAARMSETGAKAATLPITYGWLYGIQGASLAMIALLALRDAWRRIRNAGQGA